MELESWLSLNKEWITVSSNLIMAVIWLVYLHLFLLDQRRRKRPFLIIHHAQGHSPQALCLFVNMSQEPVHVLCVFADIEGPNGYIRRQVTDYSRLTPDDRNVQSRLRQGPIQPGGYLTLGTFEDIILGRQSDEARRAEDLTTTLRDYHNLNLSVAVNHGPSKYAIGARRHFVLEHDDGDTTVRALNIDTEQLTTWRKRREVRRWVEDSIEPKRTGSSEGPKTKQSTDSKEAKEAGEEQTDSSERD